MIKGNAIYSGIKYLNNLNIIYKSFNIDISPLPDVSFHTQDNNLSTIIPEQWEVQNHKEKSTFMILQEVVGLHRKSHIGMQTRKIQKKEVTHNNGRTRKD